MWPEFRSSCPVASALDVVGDKWSLVVFRTIFAGRHRFHELADIAEKISTNILADRLNRLERYGLISKAPYPDNPKRYEYHLTERGADLLPALQQFGDWSRRHMESRWPFPDWFTKGRPEQFYPDVAKDGG